MKKLFTIFSLLIYLKGYSQKISTIAGGTGDGANAINTSIQTNNITVDGSGNIYIFDYNNYGIRKVNASTGIISTIAGNGTYGFDGDGGAATSAKFKDPSGIAVDGLGNIYIADTDNHRIRKVNASTGIISTIAGNGTGAYGGDGGSATSANLNYPVGVAIDISGNIYIADYGNNRIRKVNATTGVITTVAGNGTGGDGGDGGAATAANLYAPSGVAIDTSGNIFIADTYNHRICKVSASTGIITTIAGNGTGAYGGDGGVATSANLNCPSAIALDAIGNIYIADANNHRIRKVNATTGIITTVAGIGTMGYSGDGGLATSANLNKPNGVALDSLGNIYIVDTDNNRIRKVSASTGIISTVAGNGSYSFGGDGGAAISAKFKNPNGIAVDGSGNIYIADTDNNRIRKVSALSGIINTVAGNGTAGYGGDNGLAISANLNYPRGVAIDSSGNIYIADSYNNRIRKVNISTGIISTVAGSGTVGTVGTGSYSGDGGPATSACLNNPGGVAIDGSGNIYIVDQNNHRIRMVNILTGIISTVAGNGKGGSGGDGGAATSANISIPDGIALDANGNIYIAVSGYGQIRKVNALTGIISTVAGNGTVGYGGDGGAATSAILYNPDGVAVDGSGNIYIADKGNNRIRKVDALTGIISTVAGNGTQGYGGDGGAATSAILNNPRATAFDASGNIYIVDKGNNRIRKVNFDAPIISNTISGDQSICMGSTPAILKGSTPIVRSGSFTYSWLSSTTNSISGFTTIDSSNTINYSPGALSQTTWYKRVVISGKDSDTTVALQVSVNKAISNNTITGSTQVITSGATPDKIMASAATGGDGSTYTYTWLSSTANATTGFSAIASSNVQNYTPGTIIQTTWYRRRVESGMCAADTTKELQITVITDSSIITTIAGNGTGAYRGDGGTATSANINGPNGLAIDGSGNIYIADRDNHRIRKVNALTGIITTVAGQGESGNFSGDGGAASSANLNYPEGVAIDISGNIYISDTYNHRIRKVNALTGIITTIAGQGGSGNFSGDGGAATSANINGPNGLAIDGSGNIYIADTENHRIRKVNALTGIINTVAGNGTGGYGGDGGAATSANLTFPEGVTLDNSGNIYIADYGNHRIRKVNTSTGIITTVAGNGIRTFGGDGGNATSSNLNYPSGVAIDASGNIYIADFGNHRIRKVNASNGIINTVAGNRTGAFGGDGGAATLANLNNPVGVTLDGSGNIYIADLRNNRIRKVTFSKSSSEVNNISSNETQLIVYPNPAKDQLNIEINDYEKQKAELYDITGKLVKGGIVFTKQTVIDISEFQKGLYFLNISNGKQFISRKIVVE